MCRHHSLAPAGTSGAARAGASFAARSGGTARAGPRAQKPAAAARPGRAALAGIAASRLSKALRDVPMLDATVKGEHLIQDELILVLLQISLPWNFPHIRHVTAFERVMGSANTQYSSSFLG